MKNFKYLLSAVAVASALVACSSMDVDDNEALAGNFPEGFSDSVYVNLHPELVRVQMKDYVIQHNAKLEETDSNFAAIKKAAEASFKEDSLRDVPMLHKILVDPHLGGFTEADWQSDSLSKQQRSVLNELNLYDIANDYDSLKAVPIDTFAVTYQYVMYGRDHGWAYRRCTETEKANPSYDINVYPATKLYCADESGITHEIN